MTEEEQPKKVPLDLYEVLRELGHNPESFARLIDRNASGFRRMIHGKHGVSRQLAKDIVEGLYALGYQDDPRRIWQLMHVPPEMVESARRQQSASARPVPTLGVPATAAPVSDALANLMWALGREEVDKVYTIVFGARPGDKYK